MKGFSNQGEEAGMFSGSGSPTVCSMLDASASHELCIAFDGSSRRPPDRFLRWDTPLSRQLSGEPCGLRPPYRKDQGGLPGDLELYSA